MLMARMRYAICVLNIASRLESTTGYGREHIVMGSCLMSCVCIGEGVGEGSGYDVPEE